MDRRNLSIGYLAEVVEVIVWHLDAKTILRAKQVCHLWKKSVEHLERHKHLWRHICLRDIYRPSLIDIIGFNPLSRSHKVEPLECTEDLWRAVYQSWMAGQCLDSCKKSNMDLQNCEVPFLRGASFVQIGAYIYMLTFKQLSVWNIDISNDIIYKQRINDKLFGSLHSFLQYPLCKFSQHQDLSQHSLIVPTANCIQWWAFSNDVFTPVQKLNVFYHSLSVWDNILVTAIVQRGMRRPEMTVYILEQKNNEFRFRKRNVSGKIEDFMDVTVWDNRCLVTQVFTIVIYDLNNFNKLANISNFEEPERLRIFGDFVIFTTTTNTEIDNEFYRTKKTVKYESSDFPESRTRWLCVCNVKTGQQFEVEVFGNYVTDYILHGDILIVDQPLLDKVHICRINTDESSEPLWCSDAYQNTDMDSQQTNSNVFNIVAPKVLESEHVFGFYASDCNLSYGESIVVQKDGCNVSQYIR